MVHRSVDRTVMVLLFLALATGTILQNLRFDVWDRDDTASAGALDHDMAVARTALSDLKAAESAYVATGQGPDFWMTRATDLLGHVDAALGRLQSASRSQDAEDHYSSAVSALHDLTAVDERARADVRTGQRFLAGDLIFMDALEANRRLAQELDSAQEIERASFDAQLAGVARWRLALNGGSMVLGFLLLLVVSRRAAEVAPTIQMADPEEPLPVAVPAPVATVSKPLDQFKREEVKPAYSVNLSDAAQLCVDLARVLDVRDLPPLLARAASVLDARGLVLWLADPDGQRLRPSLAHGYPDKVLRRLGPLDIDADNVTSLAFRTLELQVLAGPPNGHGAVAAPLITANGCIGVIAAEVPESSPNDARHAVARMIAAQLSTLVAPATTSSSLAAHA